MPAAPSLQIIDAALFVVLCLCAAVSIYHARAVPPHKGAWAHWFSVAFILLCYAVFKVVVFWPAILSAEPPAIAMPTAKVQEHAAIFLGNDEVARVFDWVRAAEIIRENPGVDVYASDYGGEDGMYARIYHEEGPVDRGLLSSSLGYVTRMGRPSIRLNGTVIECWRWARVTDSQPYWPAEALDILPVGSKSSLPAMQ